MTSLIFIIVILRTYLRLPESRSYESLGEILWETAGAGATAASLRTAIAHVSNTALPRLFVYMCPRVLLRGSVPRLVPPFMTLSLEPR